MSPGRSRSPPSWGCSSSTAWSPTTCNSASDARKYRSAPPAAVPAWSKPWAGKLQVAQVFDETPEVRTFRLVSTTGPRLPFDFLPGQYLNLTL